uniref:Odorant receptor n=1 Tax=Adelphocoris lineolatus TaxID=236346 RepID=A0A2I4PH30_ADELI|nr:olfactory receptor 4 [Adelphocoris lineolatus]
MGYVSSKFKSSVQEWHSWEDEYSVEAMRLRYRGFHRIGFLVLDLSPKYALLSVIMCVIAAAVLFIVSFCLTFSCYQMSDDFEDCSGVCNLGFLCVLAFSFLLNHNFYRKKILDLHHMLGKGFHDYQEPQYFPDELEKFKKVVTKQNVALIILASYVALIGFLVVVVCPLIDESLGFGWTEPYDENGVNRQLPVPIWLPYPSHEGFLHWFSFLFLEGFGGAMICLSIGGTALLFTCLSGGLMLEQKLLVLSIKSIEKRAKRRYRELHKGKPGIDEDGNKIALNDDNKYQECIGYCLRQNILHHHKILTYTNHYLDLARSPLLFAFLVETMAIAMSMVKLNEGSNKWGANIAFACIAIAEVANMIMLCVLGELVTSGSIEINDELYYTKWYTFNKSNKKVLLQFLLETRNPVVLAALGLVVCNMDQFSSVMHTAYSFFNMVKLSKLREETVTMGANT